MVQFEPDRPEAVLERYEQSPETGKSSWKVVCEGPCTRPMDIRYGYRIRGDGVVRSPWFQLPGADKTVKLNASVGRSWVRDVGVGASILGGLSLASGIVLMLPLKTGADGQKTAVNDGAIAGGLVGAGLGVVFIGLTLITASSTSASAEAVSTDKPQARNNRSPLGIKLTPQGLVF